MTTLATPSPVSIPVSRLFGAAFLGGAIAAVANLALYVGARAAGVPFEGEFQPGTLGPLPVPMVAIASLVPALPAALVALALQRFTQNGARAFGVVAVVFCVLSLGGPFGVAQASLATKLALDAMHLVAAAGIGGMLIRGLRA